MTTPAMASRAPGAAAALPLLLALAPPPAGLSAAALPALRRRVLGEPFCALARLHLLDLRQARPGCHLAKFWNHM